MLKDLTEGVFQAQAFQAGIEGNLIFRGLDWHLREGETFAILGPSGSGKTTLLKGLAGLLPYQGSLKFRATEVALLAGESLRMFRQTVSMTFQKGGLFDSLTCEQNLKLPLDYRLKLTAGEAAKRIDAILEQVQLLGHKHAAVHEMSGGMQKRLSIARALLFSPKVLLYDEPTAGLDPITARAIEELILRTQSPGATTVLVTSDLRQAKALCQTAGLLWQGGFVKRGNWAELESSDDPVVQQFLQGKAHGPITDGLHD